MAKKKTFSALKKKLDAVFSQYIRRKNAPRDGYAVCVTCHRVAMWKELQCGHYEPRQHLATRWNELNCHVQCYACNIARKGNYPRFADFLDRKYGPELRAQLERLTKQVVKLTPADLESRIEEYQQKLEALP